MRASLECVNIHDWVETQIAAAASLVGEDIVGWDAIEMAIREDDLSGEPAFSDPAVPCLQLSTLALLLDVGEPAIVGHYQNEGHFAFRVERGPVPASDWNAAHGIFRRPRLEELPTGSIRSVVTRLDRESGDLAELVLDIDGREVLLIAGEIEETWTERLVWRWLDESTLVFVDPDTASPGDWIPPRDYVELRT